MNQVHLQNSELIIVKSITPDQLDSSRSLTLREVRRKYHLKGRRGKAINMETLRRWANPKRGFRPAGDRGPTLVLPTLLRNGEHVTMPEWIEWFLKQSDQIRLRAGMK